MSNQHYTYELSEIHPAVADWLAKNGYTFKHHVNIPHVGLVDFVANHSDGHCVVLEVKRNSRNIHKSITQVLTYRHYLNPSAVAMLAIPSHAFTEQSLNACMEREVELITVDVKEYVKPINEEKVEFHRLLSKWADTFISGDGQLIARPSLDNWTEKEIKNLRKMMARRLR